MSDDDYKPKRNRYGHLLPGYSGNPGGKPKGIEKRMRHLIDSQVENWDGKTLDGWEAMTIMLYKIAMGQKPPGDLDAPITIKDRMAAAQFLFDRVHGKAKIQIETDTTLHAGGLANVDIDALNPEELDALEAHVELLAAKKGGKLPMSEVIDITPADIVEDPHKG